MTVCMATIIRKFISALLRKTFRLGLILGLMGLAGFAGLAEYTYRSGLTFLPQDTAPATTLHPDKLLHAQWVALGGQGDIPTGQMFPLHTITRIAYHWIKPPPYQASPPKDKLTWQAASILLARKQKRLGGKNWNHAKLSAAGWVNQNWTRKQQLNTVLAESYNFLGCHGVDELSRRLLEKRMDTLSIEEAALLVSIQTLPYRYLKRTGRILARVNNTISALAQNYPRRYGNAKPFSALPFGLPELSQAKRLCRR